MAATANDKHQLGAHSKEHIPWPSVQELQRLGGSPGFQIPQEPAKWQAFQELYWGEEDLASQPVFQEPHIASAWVEHTTVVDTSSLGQLPTGGQHSLMLAHPTFTFPSQGSVAGQSGVSSFHSVQSGLHLSLPCQARSTRLTDQAAIA
ncbi:hypothetical protein E2320_022758, partial [Naja naja]